MAAPPPLPDADGTPAVTAAEAEADAMFAAAIAAPAPATAAAPAPAPATAPAPAEPAAAASPPAAAAAGAGSGAGAGEAAAATPPGDGGEDGAAESKGAEEAAPAAPKVPDSEFWAEHQAWVEEVTKQGMEVRVTDPQTMRIGFGRSTMTYKVCTEPPGSVVRRRYSDFVWLRETLAARYVGVLLPTLPEKKTFGANSPEFVQTRMRSLGIFLARLLSNPYLKKDVTVHDFLSVQETKAWDKVKAAPLAERNAENEGVLKWRAAIERYRLPENADRLINDMKAQLVLLESAFNSLVVSSKRLVVKAQAFMNELKMFNGEYDKMRKLESVNADPREVEYVAAASTDTKMILDKTGAALTKWTKILTLQPLMINAIIHENLKFEVSEIVTLKELLKQRDYELGVQARAHKVLQQHTVQLETLRTQGREAKIAKQEKVVESDKVAAERADFMVIFMTKGLFFSELDRFGTTKAEMLREMFGQFAATGGAYSSRLGKLWMSLLTQLGLTPEDMVLRAKKSMDSAAALMKAEYGEAAE